MDNNTGNFGNQGNNGFNRNNGFGVFKGGNSFKFSEYKGFLKFIIIFVVAIILITIVSNMFFFTVDEREQVVVKQFNEVVKIVVDGNIEEVRSTMDYNPQLSNVKIDNRKGLHFKIPFLQSVEYYTSMMMTFDGTVREVITKDQKKLVLDNYAVWKITNPALFAMSVGNEREANKRLDDIIYSKINEEVGKVEAHVVISDKNYVADMLQMVVENANEHIKNFGMEITDVRVKRTDSKRSNHMGSTR
jgi:membrane protease subunit HflC